MIQRKCGRRVPFHTLACAVARNDRAPADEQLPPLHHSSKDVPASVVVVVGVVAPASINPIRIARVSISRGRLVKAPPEESGKDVGGG